jgi:DNA modification methylase
MTLELNKIYEGNALEILKGMPDESIDCCISSPPYYGLRAYGTNPQIWDAKEGCEHEFIEERASLNRDNRNFQIGTQEQVLANGRGTNHIKSKSVLKHGFCLKCGAWKGEFGLEPTFELYLSHLWQIYDEVYRVLKKTGTCFVNLGDSYSGSGSPGGDEYLRSYNRNQLQPKSLIQIPSRFAIGMTERGWILRNELIWYKRSCLNGGTLLYAKSQKGVMPSTVKDLVRLKPDTVKLWDGKRWNQVLEWIENKEPENVLNIKLRSGFCFNCTGDHLFPTQRGIIAASELNHGNNILSCKLPDEDKRVDGIPDIMGWFVGLYIAEGNIYDKYVRISSHQKETKRFKRLQKIAIQYDANCIWRDKDGLACSMDIYSPTLLGILDEYVAGKTSKDKHLTTKAWQRNNNFLRHLLLGYLSGDGHYEKKNKRFRVNFTRNKYLRNDLYTIGARLGISVRLNPRFATCGGKNFETYRGDIRFSKSKHFGVKNDYEIIEIKRGKNHGKYWDIVLQDEPHLFSTINGTLVHNCMPSSARDRFTVDFEKIYFFTKNKNYWFEQQFDKANYDGRNDTLYKGGPKDMACSAHERWQEDVGGNKIRNKRCVWDLTKEQWLKYCEDIYDNYEFESVWDITTKGFSEAHFATFPQDLVVPMIKAGCPEFICNKCGKAREKIFKNSDKIIQQGGGNKRSDAGLNSKAKIIQYEQIESGYTDCGCNSDYSPGIVLDPFMGSGTTAIVARKLNRNFIGIELNPKYIKMAENRLLKELGLFHQAI